MRSKCQLSTVILKPQSLGTRQGVTKGNTYILKVTFLSPSRVPKEPGRGIPLYRLFEHRSVLATMSKRKNRKRITSIFFVLVTRGAITVIFKSYHK